MRNEPKIGVCVLGGAGFGAGELLRLLSNHPEAEVVSVVSESKKGSPLTSAHPHLRSLYKGVFDDQIHWERLASFQFPCIISALPHGESAQRIEKILQEASLPNLTIIDLSGDLRLKDPALHAFFYPHTSPFPHLREAASYGLSELFSENLKDASLISNPGCLATATILALAPMAQWNVTTPPVCNVATGSSGGGREPKLSTHHPTRHANFLPYKVLAHQHAPEIEQALRILRGGAPFPLRFIPHSLPVSRGILASVTCELAETLDLGYVRQHFSKFYESAPFVRVLNSEPAELENVVGSNFCDISIAVSGNTVVIHTVIDNLVKGMAGQAIQNMNMRANIPETTGLWSGALRPI